MGEREVQVYYIHTEKNTTVNINLQGNTSDNFFRNSSLVGNKSDHDVYQTKDLEQ